MALKIEKITIENTESLGEGIRFKRGRQLVEFRERNGGVVYRTRRKRFTSLDSKRIPKIMKQLSDDGFRPTVSYQLP